MAEEVTPNVELTDIPNGVQVTHGEPVEDKGEELILGKFKTQEDFEKSYQELEQKLHSQEPLKQEEVTPNVGVDIEAPPEQAETFDTTSYEEEYAENGSLSEASYENLAKQGYTKEVVDSYISGKAALAEKWVGEVKGLAGGESEYATMTAWATTNMDQGFIDSFNEAVNSKDPNKAKMAVEALKSQYTINNGSNPSLVNGTPAVATGDSYASWPEATVDLNSEKYRRDPAERDRVMKKLSRSKI
jgi:hypothetical protein